MTEVYNQYNTTTYRLLRGLRRNIPEDVPGLTSSPPVPQQKRRVKLVAIYGQPIIAHCINQGEFLYPKVIGHKIVHLDDDEGSGEPATTDDDRTTSKPNGLNGSFAVADYLFLKNNKAYHRIRIKTSSAALDIRPWRIGGTVAAKDLLLPSASHSGVGYIQAIFSVKMPIDATYNRNGDAYRNLEVQTSTNDALSVMPPDMIAKTEPRDTNHTFYTSKLKGEKDKQSTGYNKQPAQKTPKVYRDQKKA